MISKRFLSMALCMALLFVPACTENEIPQIPLAEFYQMGLDPDTLPIQITEDVFPEQGYGSMVRRVGFAGRDLTRHDFSLASTAFLGGISFDSLTVWPDASRLPDGFVPEIFLETARDPGLGVGYLHSQGYDGSGLAVAVLGGNILRDHQEFSDDLRFYSIRNAEHIDQGWDYQGMVTVSVLAGQTCGVAPAARLHYFAVPDGDRPFHDYAEALQAIREMNQTLPAGEQIRLVVIADGLSLEDEGWDDWEQELLDAEESGLVVLYANNAAEHGFLWGGCHPYENRDQAASYRPAAILSGVTIESDDVLVPGDFRTTALHTGPDVYIYWADGGFSWAVPYLAGLCLLAWQSAPELSLDQLLDLMKATANPTEFEWKVLNPVRFIFEVERLYAEPQLQPVFEMDDDSR